MQMEGLPENNTVLIAGKIVKGCVFSHEVYGEGFYTFQISSERLSDKEDILPVTVFRTADRYEFIAGRDKSGYCWAVKELQ